MIAFQLVILRGPLLPVYGCSGRRKRSMTFRNNVSQAWRGLREFGPIPDPLICLFGAIAPSLAASAAKTLLNNRQSATQPVQSHRGLGCGSSST